jgi:hypothetical protein
MQMVGVRAKALRLLAAGGVVAAVMLPTAAMAQDVSTYGSGNTPPPSNPTQDTGSKAVEATGAQSQDSLPFTGGDVVGLALIGAGAVLGGTALVRQGRKGTAEV